eukprot:206737-Chlamydomonas_euryale.AAC.4
MGPLGTCTDSRQPIRMAPLGTCTDSRQPDVGPSTHSYVHPCIHGFHLVLHRKCLLLIEFLIDILIENASVVAASNQVGEHGLHARPVPSRRLSARLRMPLRAAVIERV